MLSRVARPSVRAAAQTRSLASFAADLPLDVKQEALHRVNAEPLPTTVQTGRLANGIPVVSVENHGPISSLSLIVNAGAAFETAENRGAAHFLRHFAFLSTNKSSIVGLTRGSELKGVAFGSTSNREHISLTAEFRRDELPYALSTLTEVLLETRFRDYEVRDISETVVQDTSAARGDQVTRALESLHRVAFNTSLGNALFCDTDLAGTMTSDKLRAHLGAAHNAGNVAIVATGVQLPDLEKLAAGTLGRLAGGEARAYGETYYGGEHRNSEFTAHQTAVALGFAGVGLKSADLPAAIVLRQLLGGASSVLHGKGSSILSKAAAGLGANVEAEAFNIAYRNTGLFGVLVRAPSADVRAATRAATQALAGVAAGVDAAQLNAAKNLAKLASYTALESRHGALSTIGAQLLSTGEFQAPSALAAKIDAVKAADVSKLAKKLISGKVSLVVEGDTAAAPLLSEISF